jgi:hypothetical protein
MTLKVPVIDTADYRLPPEVEAALGGRSAGWTDVPLVNGWTNMGGTFPTLQCRKDTDGRVHVQGMLVPPAAGSTLYVGALPLGFRPNKTHRFPVVQNSLFCAIDLALNGAITPYTAVTNYLALEFSFWTV